MKEIVQLVSDFMTDRPILDANNRSSERMATLLQGEVDEAIEVLDDPEKLGAELADVVWFVLSIAHMQGIDIEAEIREKAALNHLRYPAGKFQDGDYDEVMRECRSVQKPVIQEFYATPRPSKA